MARIAEASGMELRVFFRDQNKDIMSEFLKFGEHESIPTLVFYTKDHEYIAHYHTAGNPGRNDIDESQEIYYPPIIAAIRETGFDGYLGQEFRAKGDPVAALEKALAICRG